MTIPIKIYADPSLRSAPREGLWQELAVPVEWVENVNPTTWQSEVHGRWITALEMDGIRATLRNIPRDILMLKHFDVVLFESGKWWPRSILAQTLRAAILRHSKGLDLRTWAWVSGVSPLARVALTSVFELGYRRARIVIAPGEREAAEELITEMAKFCFGFELIIQERADMTLQPNNGSLLINTVDLASDLDLQETLMYLNFLHRPGVIVDLFDPWGEAPLLREGVVSGFQILTGRVVQIEWEIVFLRHIGIDLKLTEVEYFERRMKDELRVHKEDAK